MKSAAFLASVALVESGSLNLAWTDCGAPHGKITGLAPTSLPLGQKTTVTGSGTVDEAVSAGSFEIDLKASIISQKFTGDLCASKSFPLPLGTGTITWDGLNCPIAAGAVDVPVDIQLSSSLPGPLQNVEMTIKGADSSGAGVSCLNVKTSPAEEEPVAAKDCLKHCYYNGVDHCCNKSPYPGDDRLVCGPKSSDWIKPDQCKAPPVAAEDCVKHCYYNGVDHCCNKSPISGDDHLVCGPKSSDWIKPDQCKAPPVAAEDCFKHCYYNGVDHCCNKSPISGDDHLVCGPKSSDWIKPDQCKAPPVADEDCVKHCYYNGVDHCCNKSPYPGDDRLVCGTSSSDWIKPDQCKAPPSSEVVLV